MDLQQPIVLVAVNARWTHTAVGLRWLIANLGDLQRRARLIEYTLNDRPGEIVEQILEHDPVLVGFGVYLWNVTTVMQVVWLLKRLRPHLQVVLGGPEVSYPDDLPEGAEQADWIITGEAEQEFARLCWRLLAGSAPSERVLTASPPPLETLAFPYELYSDSDLAHRKLYVEASRGCPFGCEFCLSSRDRRVRKMPPDRVLEALDRLWSRGGRQFKFVDRALHLAVSPELLQFFLDRWEPGAFLHFEMVGDHLPGALVPLLAQFPSGAVQLEVGVQSLDPEVARLSGVRHDLEQVLENLRLLRRTTGVHLHTDLLVGLPGESLSSFAAGFDRLVAVNPQEIQVGMLKRLRGAPIRRHERQRGLVFSPLPPYEILQTQELDFAVIQRLRRFARYLDLVFNSGNFVSTVPLLWSSPSPFVGFLAFADWLYAERGASDGIALSNLARFLFRFLRERCGFSEAVIRQRIDADFHRLGRKPLRLKRSQSSVHLVSKPGALPPRQTKHARDYDAELE